ncbi:type II secretion system ATPase GspE [Desulfobacula toluolica]|uniref:protein-secreting ATPase n=1 Tax=Desulfobacula toluolica (strain DSM 7467 / Tol2) TaxID=651182 RepID=K0NIG5_DESTT|nr:type II secretion system ATPase GspE [Desulfobacula toluolica]CCK79553.1 GspE2: general secretion pathway protein E [Desulfobacula toluolica Tol2]
MKIETLSNILQNRFGIPEDMVATARESAKKQGESLQDALIRKKIAPEKLILKALELQYDIPFQEGLDVQNIRSGFTRIIPIHFFKNYYIVPLIKNDEQAEPSALEPVIVVNDPSSLQAVDDLVSILKIEKYQLVLSTKGEILSTINNLYDKKSDSAQKIVDDMEDDDSIINEIAQTSDLLDDTSDAPIIKLVNHMISQSVKAKASDIHIEPGRDSLKIRYRIDGILYDLLEPPKRIQASLITRIKVMADMDIAEKRLPQDNRIEVRIGNKTVDIRISTIPTTLGERIVLRLLDKSSSLLTLSEFGIDPDRLSLIRKLSSLPNGIILMTGPTGSGKTTTLYAMLSEINKPDINIITVEDPVEYKLEGINQIQVNPKIGLTFAKSLRSIVRQDPDVILIGEIRDHETSSIAVQSALTGHLVLSTLHTNDAASAITRLVDMGIEPFLITSAVRAVIAQRLIRVLCHECKEPCRPDALALKSIGLTEADVAQKNIFQAKGCGKCFHTGYKGRMPIFEILVIDKHHKSLILKTSDSTKIRDLALEQNMTTLLHDGIEKIFKGMTTIEEVLRVTQV